MIERANEIGSVIETRRALLDKTFRFGDLVIGQGVLPPVIVKTDNAVSVSDNSMRLAGTVYRLVQPARFFSGAPSWRDWLLMGRSEERRVGKACGSTCRSGWSPDH